MISDTNDDRLEAIAANSAANGFNQIVGVEVDAAGDDWARITVPHDETFANPKMGTIMHGGVAMTALDTAMSYAVMAALHDDPRSIGPTIDLTVTFVSPADESLSVTGTIVRLGSRQAIVEGRAVGADSGDLVATGQGIWRVFSGDR